MRYYLSLLAFVCLSLVWAPKETLAQREFQIKSDYLRQRYRDYYVRQNRLDRQDQSRRRAASAHKKSRQAWKDQYEKTRRVYALQDKKKRVVSDERHLREIEAQKRAHDKARRDYINKRSYLDRVEREAAKIPEWIEYELYPPYETTLDN